VTRVLLTGAAGFIGSHLVEALGRRGDEVIGIDNFDPFYPRAMKERNLDEIGAGPGFTFREQDMLDVAATEALLTPDTVVVHLAAKAGVRPSLADPVGYARANVTGTAAVLEAARRAGVSRIVFGSSSSVYGDSTPVPFREDAVAIAPVSPYAATKRAGELFLSSVAPIYGFRAASLRFFTVYGPRQRPDLAIHAFTRRIVEGQPITLFGDGTQSRDYTYCDDIVAGVVAAIDWTAEAPVGVEAFNLGGNRTVPTGTMVGEIARALGIEPTVQWAPMQPGDVQRTAADLAKSGALLGYAPKTPFPEGIDRFVAWFRRTHAAVVA
jgi:UDP-glucuronate 4-epimerase